MLATLHRDAHLSEMSRRLVNDRLRLEADKWGIPQGWTLGADGPAMRPIPRPDHLPLALRPVSPSRGEEKLAAACDETTDEDLWVACTHALLAGADPPVATDWADIQKTLGNSQPEHDSLTAAMSDLRGRPWSEDG